MDENKIGNGVSEIDISPLLKRKEKTVAITIRIKKSWLRKLDKIADGMSIRYGDTINHCDVIRNAIDRYIRPRIRNRFPKSCRECDNRMRHEAMLAWIDRIMSKDKVNETTQ